MICIYTYILFIFSSVPASDTVEVLVDVSKQVAKETYYRGKRDLLTMSCLPVTR